jgi:hypothetical protein
VDLTRVEFDLLAAAGRQGAAVSRAWLAEHVLDPEREVASGRSTSTCRLRKLGAAARRSRPSGAWATARRPER